MGFGRAITISSGARYCLYRPVEKKGGISNGAFQKRADRLGNMNGTSAAPNTHLCDGRTSAEASHIATIIASARAAYAISRIGTILLSSGNFSNSVHGAAIVG
jgi:hypothetical protein